MRFPKDVSEQSRVVLGDKTRGWRPDGFAVSNRVYGFYWSSCRDFLFNAQTNRTFYFGAVAGTRVVRFMREVEDRLGLIKRDRLGFRLTDKRGVIAVRCSKWWMEPHRRSLLSALLRAGRNYRSNSPEGFEEALYSVSYTRDTRKAVQRFFKGHTDYSPEMHPKLICPRTGLYSETEKVPRKFTGWVRMFGDDQQGANRLQKPQRGN